jgi:hypothetical protein
METLNANEAKTQFSDMLLKAQRAPVQINKNGKPAALDIFSFPHVGHVIYYILHERQLIVFGVLHKSMVPSKHLDEREII